MKFRSYFIALNRSSLLHHNINFSGRIKFIADFMQTKIFICFNNSAVYLIVQMLVGFCKTGKKNIEGF